MMLRFARIDFLQTLKFTAIVWVAFVGIHVGQSAFQPSPTILVGSVVLLPGLLVVVFVVRLAAFAALYALNARNFDIAYVKFRRRAKQS